MSHKPCSATAKDSKNRWMLGFLEYLVASDIFHSVRYSCSSFLPLLKLKANWQVELSFLHVGHTHKDIDQLFGRVAQKLYTTDSKTPREFLLNLTTAVKDQQITAEFLPTVFNFKDWIGPHLNDIDGHSTPHYFLFQKNDSNQVAFWHKDRCDDQWIPKPNLLKSLPKGAPAISPIDLTVLNSFIKTSDRLQKILVPEEIAGWTSLATEMKGSRGKPFELDSIPRVDQRAQAVADQKQDQAIKRLGELLKPKSDKLQVKQWEK